MGVIRVIGVIPPATEISIDYNTYNTYNSHNTYFNLSLIPFPFPLLPVPPFPLLPASLPHPLVVPANPPRQSPRQSRN